MPIVLKQLHLRLFILVVVVTIRVSLTIRVDGPSDIKTLNDADFEQWRSQLRSFIPEATNEFAQRVFVSSKNGTELVSVDLSPVFNASITVGKLIQEVQALMGQLKFAGSKSGLMEGMASFVMTRSESEEALASLSIVVEQLAAEHANLSRALGSKIPSTSSSYGIMRSIGHSHALRSDMSVARLSMSSFHTTATGEGEGVFYDADAAESSMQEESRDESSVAEDLEEEEEEEEGEEEEEKGKPVKGDAKAIASAGSVTYRKQLPAKVSGDEVSLFSMLKKNVGKDLATISFPVSFNCPLSLLQASCEEYEYAHTLLERASKTEDWVERICLVAAFAVSSYSSTKLRASRKPFNPLLGETFECVRDDRGLRFVAEKVVHQPPIVASYAEGKGWHAVGWSAVKNKFWGKSLELVPEGQLRLDFDNGDAFSFTKPSSFMRNLLAGNRYLEHVGELTVSNVNTGQKAVIEFKEGNMWGGVGSRNAVQGIVYDEKGKKITGLKGKWSDNFSRQKDEENYQVLWEAEEMPRDAECYYGFTYFAMSLNEITDDIRPYLPPTDTRLRPDQRAFEKGKVDEAEKIKHELEGKQRERRKRMESNGEKFEPRWFHKSPGDDPGWQFGGKLGIYFDKRKEAADEGGKKLAKDKKAWFDVPNIFEL